MVEQKICSFCGGSIEPGTGRLYIRKDGVTFNFCSNKCFKNMMALRKVPRDTQWTAQYIRDKEVRLTALSHPGKEGAKKAAASKVRRVVKPQKSGKKEAPAEMKEIAEEPEVPKKEKGDES